MHAAEKKKKKKVVHDVKEKKVLHAAAKKKKKKRVIQPAQPNGLFLVCLLWFSAYGDFIITTMAC